MTDPARPSARPLVTFALFAYNQERYIREAVEGAFAQTYEPLEIILSDDCSSDRTFGIMQEMAAGYRGPHEVRARRSEANRGVLRHVMEVADEAAGAFMVVAAGDDISLPQRAAVLAAAWRAGAGAVDSFYDIIDMSGNTVAEGRQSTQNGQAILNSFDPPLRLVGGFGSAYETGLIRAMPRTDRFILNEDTVMTVGAHLNGRLTDRVPEVLVRYRSNPNSLTNAGRSRNPAGLAAHERAAQRWAEAALNLHEYIDELLVRFDTGGALRRGTQGRLDTLLRFARFRRDFLAQASFWKRLAWLRKARSAHELRWGVSRLGGPRVYGVIASLRDRLKVLKLGA